MADRLARARRRRRRRIVGAIVVVAVAGGAGTAWALRGGDGASYRYATATRGDISETVDADGTLTATRTATLAFAAAGTVTAVGVTVGQRVRAGQTVATIDDTDLVAAVTTAQATVTQAEQKLSDDEDAQAAGTTTATTATSTTSNFAGVRLDVAIAPTAISRAQDAVVAAQHDLDAAIATQDADVRTLVTACATGDETTPSRTSVTPGDAGTVSGAAGASAAVVTLRDAHGDVAQTTSANPQRVTAGGGWSFTGLTSGTRYVVAVTRADVISTDDCLAAVQDVQDAQRAVDTADTHLAAALTALAQAIAGSATGGSGRPGGSGGTTGGSGTTGAGSGGTTGRSGGTTGAGKGARSTGGGSGTSGSGAGGATTGGTRSGSATTSPNGGTGATTTTTITAAQIAADTKSIDAAKADLAVAAHAVGSATLTSPVAGTVAAVKLTKGAAVGAGSTSNTITVVGDGALTVALSVGLSEIDKIKVGQHASVTVDGHTTPYAATVSTVGLLNTGDSTGSSAAYAVTVQLDRTEPALYDGMGAAVSIAVGTARNVVTLPLSAVHTIGTRHTVVVVSGSGTATKLVTLGLTGTDRVQVTAGLAAGQRVVLADLDAAVPSATTNIRRSGSGLTGLTGSSNGPPGGFTGGGFAGGGRPGGR